MNEQNLLEKLFNRQLIPPIGQRIIRTVMLIFWSLLIALLLWTAWKNRFQIAPLITNADYSKLSMVLLYYSLNLFSTLFGWAVIVRSLDFPLKWWRQIQIYCATFGLRRLPGTVWYVGGRIIIYQRLGVPKLKVLQASIIELIVEFISAGLVGLGLFLILGYALPDLLITSILISLIIGMIILFPCTLKLLFKNKFLNNLKNMQWSSLIICILAYSLMWIMGGLMVSKLIGIVRPLDSREIGFVVGSWSLSGMAGLLTIFLPTTFGAMELSLTALLSQILPLPLAGAIAISTRLITFLMEVLMSVVFYPLLGKFQVDVTN